MAYLTPHFDPDVFVSYSHGNPIGGRAPPRGWSHALILRLKDGLRALRAEFDDLDIWMDPEIDPTAHLTDALRGKASACGVLMIIMSERYLNSKWCKEEREWFEERINERPGTDGRVFVIRAQETDAKLWPDFLRDELGHGITGFSFYDPDSGDPWGFQLRSPTMSISKNWAACGFGSLSACANCASAPPMKERRRPPPLHLRQGKDQWPRAASIFMRPQGACPRAPKSISR